MFNKVDVTHFLTAIRPYSSLMNYKTCTLLKLHFRHPTSNIFYCENKKLKYISTREYSIYTYPDK